jgi:hypothetical protein
MEPPTMAPFNDVVDHRDATVPAALGQRLSQCVAVLRAATHARRQMSMRATRPEVGCGPAAALLLSRR